MGVVVGPGEVRIRSRAPWATTVGQRTALAVVALACLAVFGLEAVLVGSRAGWLVAADGALSRDAAQAVHTQPWLQHAARLVTQLGDPVVVDIATGVLVVVLLAHRWWPAAVAVLLARLIGLGAEHLFKALIDRPRPVTVPPVATAGGSSFPSGHSTGAAGLAATAALVLLVSAGRRRWAVAVAGVLALLACAVAASRVLLVVHYPSDVVAGLLLGVASATVSVAALTAPLPRRTVRDDARRK